MINDFQEGDILPLYLDKLMKSPKTLVKEHRVTFNFCNRVT
jgi:hypothetical protein